MSQAKITPTRWLAIVAWIGLAPLGAGVCHAATFRVTTKLYEGSRLDPSAEHRVLFDQGIVFDLPQIESRLVTVYDPAQDRVTLLDRQTQVQTEIRIEDLVKVTAQARAAAVTPEQRERLGLSTQVEASKRVLGYSVRFGNLEYHATTQKPDDPTMAIDYGRFAILASRLNIVRRLGPPPFGRMTLSDHMTARGEVPLETMLTMKRGEKSEDYRSTHQLEELTEADREKILEIRGMMSLYRKVNFEEFPK